MTLTEFYSKPLSEVIKNANITQIYILNDENGAIDTIEIKYKPRNTPAEIPDFLNK